MENKKWWIKFKNSKWRLIALCVGSLVVGTQMFLIPKTVSEIVIRGIGVIWILEGISYSFDLWIIHLKKRKEALFINGVVGSYESKPYADLCKLRKEKIEDLKRLEKVMKDVCAGVGKYTDTGGNYKP